MESDNTTGTESDTSEWDLAQAALTSENSEDSDEYGIYYGDEHMFDTAIGGNHGSGQRFIGNQMSDRETNLQMRKILNQLNMTAADSGYSGSSSLYPIHETGLTTTDSSGSEENSDGTVSDTDSPVQTRYPVYGRYQKLPSQDDKIDKTSVGKDEELDNLMLHRLTGENLGMILGIEGGKDGVGTVTSVAVKSVTLGGAAYRATGSSKGICVGDEIVMVNGLNLQTLTHDECIQVFKDMPLRVLLGIKRGQKDLPPFSVSPLPVQDNQEQIQKLEKEKSSNLKSETPVQIRRRQDGSDSEDDGFGGFASYIVTIDKDPDENLGISIVPSYGSTREYYQIKRILPSGAAAHTEELQVGDRLITCNGTSLRALKQNQCLNIIRSASSNGSLTFEVCRPVYTGSSMEISVTLNNGTNSYSKIPGSFDPSQYSLKSQSYDRNVDVIVTSESEDYLTVSEDEYSRSGRLEDIPEVEANEVFANNSVKLAFQAPLNTLEEESTETETENSPRKETDDKSEDIDIVDLNKFDTSPYHIPGKQESKDKQRKFDLKQYRIVPKSEKDHNYSFESKQDLSKIIPRSDIDAVSVTSSILPKSDLDKIAVTSPVPKSDIDQISPRSLIPNTGLGSSYTKRQQIPIETSYLNLPYNYPPDSVGHNIPVSDSEETRYNPLYEDSNLSEFTDSEPQDIYITSTTFKSKESVPASDLDKVSVGSDSEDIAVPPPAEFSDNQTSFEENPVTYIDDILRQNSASLETSPIHKKKTYTSSTPEYQVDDSISENERNAHLAFNAELTAPFDLVLQEQGICVQTDNEDISDFEESPHNEILQVVTSYDNGTVLISQFEPEKFKENTKPPVYCVTNFEHTDNKMDQNSEAMLKDALDMEYENLPNSIKYEARLKLGENVENGNAEFDDPSYSNENVVAEIIAKDIVRNEQGNYGYFVESDDEPDQFPEEDAPEDVPDLPNMPPPVLNKTDKQLQNDVTVSIYTNGNDAHLIEKSHVSDDNWTLTAKTLENNNQNTANKGLHESNGNDNEADIIKRKVEIPVSYKGTQSENQKPIEETEEIVPVRIQRKAEILISSKIIEKEEDDLIIPVTAKRDFQLPSTFSDRIPSPRQDDKIQDHSVDLGIKKVPPPVHPKPKKNIPHKNLGEGDVNDDTEAVQEEIITPSEVKKDTTRHLVNVISVVNALKANAKERDPDIVDKIEKQDAKNRVKPVFSSVIKVDQNDRNQIDLSPPKLEQVVASRAEISFSNKPVAEALPPKQDVIEITKDVISKADKQKLQENHENMVENPVVQADSAVPKLMTTITVEKAKVETELQNTKCTAKQHDITDSDTKLVPPLNLESVSGVENDSLSPKSEHSDQTSPTSKYKTTIGVPKPQTAPAEVKVEPLTKSPSVQHSDKAVITSSIKEKDQDKPALAPTPQIKPLSHIKPLSFNPKSLSQTSSRSVQYKTTIGVKPGLPTLSKPSSSSQKADHPIKRMETMPFEVSILKGILGIGIKTVMTPEGYVKVTEILPNGPVGREGNIKVGDYILSINSTQLTGLTDGKVQQILRLLPRGLSKIVASAMIPDQSTEQPAPETEKLQLAPRQSLPSATAEKPKLSPRQSTPLSSPRQPTIRTNPNAEVQLSVQPVAAPRSFTSQQASGKSVPPPVAPRPASRPHSSPGVSRRICEDVSANTDQSQMASKEQLHKQSPASSSSSSPVVSPRQKDFQSPRTPPAVAPKPKRTLNQKAGTHIDDSSKPIEAELFVSINAANESSPGTGNRNMLPGSVNYDIVQGVSKTNWTAGMVSSADLKKPEKKNDIKSNVDVVDVSSSQQSVDVTDTNAPDSNVVNGTCLPHTDNNSEHLNDQDNILETKEKPCSNVSEAVEKLSNIEKDLDTSQVDVSLLSNRSRTFSSSSNASSYTEFTECDVEGENIPEDIAEEEEGEFHENSGVQKDENDEEYESDFEVIENDGAKKEKEGDVDESENSVQSPDSGFDMDRLKTLAQNIVTDVISSIKKSDFDAEETKLDEPSLKKHDSPTSHDQTEAPFLPESPPPSFGDHQIVEPQAPSLPESPPPLPNSEVPSDVAREVVDLALYPDSDQSSEGTSENRTEQGEKEVNEVIDIVDVSVSTTLHAAAPDASLKTKNVNTDNDFENGKVENVSSTMTDFTESFPTDNEIDTSVSQVIDDSKGQEDDINMEDNDEQSVSNVITMYSNLEKSLEEQNTQVYNSNIETNNNVVNKELNLAEEQIERCDTNSLRSSFNTVSDLDPCGKVDSNIEKTNEEPLKELNSTVMEKVNGHADEVFVKPSKLTESFKDEAESPRLESLSPRLDSMSPRLGSTSPRSDTDSPRSEGKFTSRVDRILSQAEELEKGKCSPETDKMFRMLSTSEEPTPTGDGELVDVTVNKGVTGLGFIIQGGKGTPKGDLPITIKRIFKGGPADGILQVTDELCSVNGEDLSDMRHTEAWNHLKFLPSGNIVMRVRRYKMEDNN